VFNFADFIFDQTDMRFGEIARQAGAIIQKLGPTLSRHPRTMAAAGVAAAVFTPVGRAVTSNLAGGAAYKAVQQPVMSLFGGKDEKESQAKTQPQTEVSGLWGPPSTAVSEAGASKKTAVKRKKASKRKPVKRKAAKRKPVKRKKKVVKRKVKAR